MKKRPDGLPTRDARTPESEKRARNLMFFHNGYIIEPPPDCSRQLEATIKRIRKNKKGV